MTGRKSAAGADPAGRVVAGKSVSLPAHADNSNAAPKMHAPTVFALPRPINPIIAEEGALIDTGK